MTHPFDASGALARSARIDLHELAGLPAPARAALLLALGPQLREQWGRELAPPETAVRARVANAWDQLLQARLRWLAEQGRRELLVFATRGRKPVVLFRQLSSSAAGGAELTPSHERSARPVPHEER